VADPFGMAHHQKDGSGFHLVRRPAPAPAPARGSLAVESRQRIFSKGAIMVATRRRLALPTRSMAACPKGLLRECRLGWSLSGHCCSLRGKPTIP